MPRPHAETIPDGGRGWWPVVAHAFVAGVTQLYWLTYAPVATDAAAAYGTTEAMVTWLANVYPILYFVLAIPVGWLLDRRPRPTLVTGAVLTAAGGVVRALAPASFEAALAGQILVAIAQPVLLNGLVVVAHQHLPPQRRPAGIALGTVGFFVGIFLGFTTPVLFLGTDGVAPAGSLPDLAPLLEFQAGLGLIGGAWMVWTARHAVHTPAEAAGTHGREALTAVWANPGMRVVAGLAFGGFGVFGALMTVLQPLLEPRGISRDQADLLVDGLVLAGLLVAAVIPAWAARTGNERGLLLGGLVAASAATALAAVDLPLVVLAVALSVAGGLLVPALPVLLEISERLEPELTGTASAVVWLAGNLGVAVMTVAAQLLLGVPAAAFAALAAGGLITALFGARRLDRAVLGSARAAG